MKFLSIVVIALFASYLGSAQPQGVNCKEVVNMLPDKPWKVFLYNRASLRSQPYDSSLFEPPSNSDSNLFHFVEGRHQEDKWSVKLHERTNVITISIARHEFNHCIISGDLVFLLKKPRKDEYRYKIQPIIN